MPSQGPSSEIAASLDNTYYIVHRSKMIIFPLLLCMALCAAVALIGYVAAVAEPGLFGRLDRPNDRNR